MKYKVILLGITICSVMSSSAREIQSYKKTNKTGDSENHVLNAISDVFFHQYNSDQIYELNVSELTHALQDLEKLFPKPKPAIQMHPEQSQHFGPHKDRPRLSTIAGELLELFDFDDNKHLNCVELNHLILSIGNKLEMKH